MINLNPNPNLYNFLKSPITKNLIVKSHVSSTQLYMLKFRCLNFFTKRLIHIYGNSSYNRKKFPEKFAKIGESCVYFEEKVPSVV